MKRQWKCSETNPPTKTDRYWGYVEEITDLGKSTYQCNCFYDKEENRWSSHKVVYWSELLDDPKQYFRNKKLKRITK